MVRHAILIAIAAVASAALCRPAEAQSLEPMRGEITSFADRFAIKVYPGNPYPDALRIDVRVYDRDYQPIAAMVTPPSVVIGAKQRRRALVIVPFDGADRREIRICAEATPLLGRPTRIRTQTCGRFLATRHTL